MILIRIILFFTLTRLRALSVSLLHIHISHIISHILLTLLILILYGPHLLVPLFHGPGTHVPGRWRPPLGSGRGVARAHHVVGGEHPGSQLGDGELRHDSMTTQK